MCLTLRRKAVRSASAHAVCLLRHHSSSSIERASRGPSVSLLNTHNQCSAYTCRSRTIQCTTSTSLSSPLFTDIHRMDLSDPQSIFPEAAVIDLEEKDLYVQVFDVLCNALDSPAGQRQKGLIYLTCLNQTCLQGVFYSNLTSLKGKHRFSIFQYVLSST